MRKFSINCEFSGQISPFTVYIGQPKPGNHALDHQAKWLASERQGTIPAEVMDAISKLQELADTNGVLLEELCVYALGNETEEKTAETPNNSENNVDDGATADDNQENNPT